MKKNNYKLFEYYVLRTPLFPIQKFIDFDPDNAKHIDALLQEELFLEAIFLASPELYDEIKNLINQSLSPKKEEKLRFAITKYLSRMCSRATPFGLFAGVNMGKFDAQTSIKLSDISSFERHTRLDMNYLVALAQNLSRQELIKNQLLFYPNTSIYQIGNFIRYVEYYYENARRTHEIVSVENSIYLQQILDAAQNGANFDSLVKLICNDEISIEDASGFIDQLIDSQLLISELEPGVTGEEFLGKLIKKFSSLNNLDQFTRFFKSIDEKLRHIDQKIGNVPSKYETVKNELLRLGTTFNPKYLFQTDLAIKTKENTLSESLKSEYIDTLSFLNRLTTAPQNDTLKQFGKNLYKRYENRPVPISLALDNELGISLKSDLSDDSVNPLVDDLLLPDIEKKQDKSSKWNEVSKMLHRKICEAKAQNAYQIDLYPTDLKNKKVDWDDLPDTFSSIVNLVQISGKEMFYMPSAGHSSATNLLGRFCFVDKDVLSYVQTIANKETVLQKDKIVAEIVHLPESRVGNILLRPRFRKYEIPYLAQTDMNDNMLNINDLYVVSDHLGNIKLFSKKLGKEVLPRLSNAHNFKQNALPIYHFLALMQTQNKRDTLAFSWGVLREMFDFLPRVVYKKAILSLAQWRLHKPVLDSWRKLSSDKLLAEVSRWRKNHQVPEWLVYPQKDNKLLLDLSKHAHVKLLLDMTRNQRDFFLEEYLFSEGSPSKRHKDLYANEVILAFYKNDLKN